MPDPDPQPPQPRSTSPARWLLMLTPSVLTIASPLIAQAWSQANRKPGEDTLGILILSELLSVVAAIVLCFILGVFLEKWHHGNVRSWPRAIGCGFLILIVNGIISFAGCAVITSVFNL